MYLVIAYFLACSIILLILSILIHFYVLKNAEINGVSNRTVLITGCDTGFGHIPAKLLDERGVRTIACCLTQNGAQILQESSSSRLMTIQLDITDPESIADALRIVKDMCEDGGLWGLVNNAGVMPTFAPIEWTTMDEFEITCKVNLLGTIVVTKAFLPLVRQAQGRIVNVCSVTSNCAYPGITNYVVSKAALKTFSICLRRELFSTGVTVHTIEPGGFRTSLTGEDKIRKAFTGAYKAASKKKKAVYGGNIATYVLRLLRTSTIFFAPDVEKVPRKIVYALFARYPNQRYIIGYDANTFFRVLSLLHQGSLTFS